MGRSAAAAFALLLVACGGDDGDDLTPGSSSTSTTPVTVDAAAAGFCDAFGALLVGPLAEGGFDPQVPDQLRAAVDVSRPLVAALRAEAPPEIAEAATFVADAYDSAFAVLDRYGYDLARVEAEATPTEQAALDNFGRSPTGPGLDDPYDDVDAFVAERCAPGVTLPPDLTGTTSP
jgi:hypothetical protein